MCAGAHEGIKLKMGSHFRYVLCLSKVKGMDINMKENQQKDIITYVRLIKYGMNARQCLCAMLLFTVIGIAFEIMLALGTGVYRDLVWIDFGALFLYSAAMYPGQILMSLDISGMVQASPYKRKIQTSAMAFVSLCGNLAAFVIVLLVRGLSAWGMPQRAALIWSGLPVIGLMGMGLSIMGALLYKFYILSLIVIAVVFGGCGSFGAVGGNVRMNMPGVMSLPAAIALCVALILLGNGIQYLIVRIIYKRPFSKGAFGNAVGKKFV